MTLKKALRPHRTRSEREGELTRIIMGMTNPANRRAEGCTSDWQPLW
jgi:hypothetical protein